MYTKETTDRFWSKVKQGIETECWLWIGPIRSARSPYGTFSIGQTNMLAHRVAYVLAYGALPAGAIIRHTCDNPPCVNPRHLVAGTQKDNIHDMLQRERFTPPRGEKCGTHKLTESQVVTVRERYAKGDIVMQHLANEYGISLAACHAILHGRTWNHVGGPILTEHAHRRHHLNRRPAGSQAGEINGLAKFSWPLVEWIRSQQGIQSAVAIARDLQVSSSTIERVYRNQTWIKRG